jgi:hypothetical protein
MMLYKPGFETTTPPTAEQMAAMGQFIGELSSEGVLLSTDGLLPSVHGTRVRYDGTEFSVTDGPFAETKELIAGFAIVQVESKEQAVDIGRRFLEAVGGGESELRLMFDATAFEAEDAKAS